MCLESGESMLSKYFPALKRSESPPSLPEAPKAWGQNNHITTAKRKSGTNIKPTASVVDPRKFYLPTPINVYARPDALRQIDRWDHCMEIDLEHRAEWACGNSEKPDFAGRTGTAESSFSNESTKTKQKKRKAEKDRNDETKDKAEVQADADSTDDMSDANAKENSPMAQLEIESKIGPQKKKKKRRKRLRRRPPGYVSWMHPSPNYLQRKDSSSSSSAPGVMPRELPIDKVHPAAESRHICPTRVPDLSLTFDSQFESGNLLRAQLVGMSDTRNMKMGVQEYDLVLQNDLFTNGHVQW